MQLDPKENRVFKACLAYLVIKGREDIKEQRDLKALLDQEV